MKWRHIFFALLAGVTAALFAACSKSGADHEAEQAKTEDSRVKRGANGETMVVLDGATQKRIGLEVTAPAPAQWQPEVRGYGRVLDPAPLAGLVAEWDSARAASDASRQEHERLKVLAQQDNASARALQAAEAAAKRDQLLVETARAKLVLGWGKALVERTDPGMFARSLTLGETALVRIDLPAGEALKSTPVSARLVSLNDEVDSHADLFGPAPAVDPQTQGQGFLFLSKEKTLAPGAAVTGYLRIPGEPVSGVIIPGGAALRHEGKAWVYLRTGDDMFTRREIALDRPADNGWFVSGGITAKDRVVVSGGQTILSEELSSGGFRSGERE